MPRKRSGAVARRLLKRPMDHHGTAARVEWGQAVGEQESRPTACVERSTTNASLQSANARSNRAHGAGHGRMLPACPLSAFT